MNENVRIDKYLWAVRVYKTRNLAADECKKAHILINNTPVKPSRIIKSGDVINIKFPPIVRTFVVTAPLEKRVSATLAKNYVTETTPESEFEKLKNAKNDFVQHDKGSGRPTKKERKHC